MSAKIMPPAERPRDALLDAHGAALGGGLADAHHREHGATYGHVEEDERGYELGNAGPVEGPRCRIWRGSL